MIVIFITIIIIIIIIHCVQKKNTYFYFKIFILKHIIFSQPMLTPNDHPLPTRPDSL